MERKIANQGSARGNADQTPRKETFTPEGYKRIEGGGDANHPGPNTFKTGKK